jgi:AraC-like DNA-binding protein/ligand-binding sensor protein
MAKMRPLEGRRLAASEAWARFSAILLELTGMPTALYTPDGTPFAMHFAPEDLNPICRLVQEAPGGLEACLGCNRHHFGRVAQTRQPTTYRCHVGLVDIALPVVYENEMIAIVSTGQLLPTPAQGGGFEAIRQRCERFGIPDDALRQAYYGAPYLSEKKIDSVVSLLTFFAEYLCEMSRRIRDLTEERYPPMVRRALALISDRLSDDLSLPEIASAVDYSPAHFGRRFKRATGLSFTDYVRDARLDRAKHDLATTRRLVADIAVSCGFGSLSQFNRTFRKAVGCSPREYRQSRVVG